LFNQKFKDNWYAILKYNSNIRLKNKDKIVETKVKIPFTPIEVEPHLIHYLFKTLYPKFVNDQQNILDVIISDDGKEVIRLYLYETKEAGIHQSIERLPLDFIKFHKKDLKDLDNLYNRILGDVFKKKGIRVSSLRIFKEKAITYINEYFVGLEDTPFDVLIMKVLNLIQKMVEQDLFSLYPEPEAFKFIKGFINLLNGIQLDEIFRIIYILLPEFNFAFILGSKELGLIMHLQKVKISKQVRPYLRFKLMSPADLALIKTHVEIKLPKNKAVDAQLAATIDNQLDLTPKNLNKNEVIQLVRDQLKTEKAYYLKQTDLISIITDLFNLPVNLKDDNLKLIFQKILFGYRSYENHWKLQPKPKIYNNLRRFLIRLLGINYNLRKLSHWAISDFIFSLYRGNLGLNCKILFFFTDVAETKYNRKGINFLGKVTKHIIFVEVENGALTTIKVINKEDLILNKENESLESIWLTSSTKLGFLSTIVILDKTLLQEFISHFIFEQTKFAPFKKMKILKMFKNKKYFDMFPEIPPYKLLRKHGAFSLFKLLLPIFIDRHEF